MANSTVRQKPRKPYPDFPLFPHASGQWAKKIRGKLHYFGVWGDWQSALARYQKERDYLQRGLPVPEDIDGLSVRDLINHFLTAKESQLEAGEIGARHFVDLKTTCGSIIECFGRDRVASSLTAKDFEQLRGRLAQRYGPTRLSNEIVRTRSVFGYAYDAALLDAPIRFGPLFKKPALKRVRLHRQQAKLQHGGKEFTAHQLRRVWMAAPVHLRAMLLLGINGGMGNQDIGTLPIGAVDLNEGMLEYTRPKTGIERKFPLWDETISALRESLANRPKPNSAKHADLFFVTKYGGPWATGTPSSPVSQQFRKLLNETKVYRPGLSFYALRHTFRTVVDAHADRPAIDLVMGHADASMAGHYRESIDDQRLLDAVNVAHRWLFPRPTIG